MSDPERYEQLTLALNFEPEKGKGVLSKGGENTSDTSEGEGGGDDNASKNLPEIGKDDPNEDIKRKISDWEREHGGPPPPHWSDN